VLLTARKEHKRLFANDRFLFPLINVKSFKGLLLWFERFFFSKA